MNTKITLHTALHQQLLGQIQTARQAMAAAAESRDNETKSSVGDKYETGRAMMQIEHEKNEVQLHKLLQLEKELLQIKVGTPSEKVILGSLVTTNLGKFYISIGLGKIVLGGSTYFAISTIAPVGKLLLGKKAQATITFNDRVFKIEKIE